MMKDNILPETLPSCPLFSLCSKVYSKNHNFRLEGTSGGL